MTLEQARAAFLEGVKKSGKAGAANIAIIESVIDDLITWSRHPSRKLQFEPPGQDEHSQATLGFRLAGPNGALVWNAFPRQKDGAKIDFISRKSRSFSEAKRAKFREFVKTIPDGEAGPVPKVPVVALRDPGIRIALKRALDELLDISPSIESSVPDTSAPVGPGPEEHTPTSGAGHEETPEVRRHAYNKEFTGTTPVTTPLQPGVMNRRHGDVVDALHRELEARGWITSNDEHRDLMAARTEGPPRILFEVKTTASRDDIYKGTGQLFVNGPDSADMRLMRVLVLPGTPEGGIDAALKRLGIEVVPYSFSGTLTGDQTVTFSGLTVVLDAADR